MQEIASGKRPVVYSFVVVLALLFLGGCLGAGNTTLPSSDISGTWSTTVTPTGGSAQTNDVTIAQAGNDITVTGTILGQTVTATGTDDGQTVTFSFTTGGSSFVFTGSVNSDGNSISNGTYTQNDSAAGTWSATKKSTSTADFTISCDPIDLTSTTNTSDCELTAVNGFSDVVELTCDPEAPTTGGSCSFNPLSLTPTTGGVPSKLTYTCGTAGIASFDVVGKSGDLTHSVTMSITCS